MKTKIHKLKINKNKRNWFATNCQLKTTKLIGNIIAATLKLIGGGKEIYLNTFKQRRNVCDYE